VHLKGNVPGIRHLLRVPSDLRQVRPESATRAKADGCPTPLNYGSGSNVACGIRSQR
jgi:hypothetical protein